MYTKSLRDLEEISDLIHPYSESLRGKRIQIIGATGFVGRWLTESLIFHSNKYSLETRISCLGRTPIDVLQSYVTNFKFNFQDPSSDYELADLVFFAVTPSQPKTGGNQKDSVISSVDLGLRNLITRYCASEKLVRFINCSSGAVQAIDSELRLEGQNILKAAMEAEDLKEVYKNTKLLGEKLILDANHNNNFKGLNARLWTFYGFGISINDHFAIGNFMKNAISRESILVKGNPETIRSYMYPTELVGALVTAAFETESSTINIGSYEPISIGSLAQLIASEFDIKNVEYLDPKSEASSYFPEGSENSLTSNFNKVKISDGLQRWYSDLVNQN